jgi:hypothetical protein
VASHSGGSFETVRRVRDGAVLWLATCSCGRCWAEHTYEAAQAEWRKHVNAEKETPQ